jgi:hypothetical protein
MCFRGIDIIGDLARWGERGDREGHELPRDKSRATWTARSRASETKTSRCRARDRDRLVTYFRGSNAPEDAALVPLDFAPGATRFLSAQRPIAARSPRR